jgi:hypothetical protein
MGYVPQWSYEAQKAFPALRKAQQERDAFDFKVMIIGCIVMALIVITGIIAVTILCAGRL